MHIVPSWSDSSISCSTGSQHRVCWWISPTPPWCDLAASPISLCFGAMFRILVSRPMRPCEVHWTVPPVVHSSSAISCFFVRQWMLSFFVILRFDSEVRLCCCCLRLLRQLTKCWGLRFLLLPLFRHSVALCLQCLLLNSLSLFFVYSVLTLVKNIFLLSFLLNETWILLVSSFISSFPSFFSSWLLVVPWLILLCIPISRLLTILATSFLSTICPWDFVLLLRRFHISSTWGSRCFRFWLLVDHELLCSFFPSSFVSNVTWFRCFCWLHICCIPIFSFRTFHPVQVPEIFW